MKTLRVMMSAASLALLMLLAFAATSPAAEAQAQGANLLLNSSFEEGWYSKGLSTTSNVPNGWDVWYVSQTENGTPIVPNFERMTNPTRVRSGYNAFNIIGSYITFQAGLVQQVAVTPGNKYLFEVWIHTSATDNANIPVKIGIDPTGGGNALSGSVVWSAVQVPTETVKDNPGANYKQFLVEAVAQNNIITVFTWARPDWPVARTDVYIDDAYLGSLGAVAPTAGPTSAQPTQPPAQSGGSGIATAQADSSGQVIHTVRSGENLSSIAFAYGVTISEIQQLNNLSGTTILVGQRLIIKSGAAAPTPTTAPATAAPAEGATQDPAATADPNVPTATPEQVAEAPASGNGTVCVLPFQDSNANGFRDLEEAGLSQIVFSLVSGGSAVATYTSDGTLEPHCFTDVSAGDYIVSWAAEGYTPTTEQQWAVTVAAGGTLSREFGLRGAGDTPTVNEPDSSIGGEDNGSSGGGLPVWVTALIGALGVMFLLGGLGAAGYFFILRRTKV